MRKYIGVIVLILCACVAIENRYCSDMEQATTEFRSSQSKRIAMGRVQTESALNGVYQGLRTIARLPGVQKIDRYASDFSEDSRKTAQEIYNNLSGNIDVAKLYIVSADFTPDQIDPLTGELQSPITVFHKADGRNPRLQFSKVENQGSTSLNRLEKFEFRLIQEQLAIFKKLTPNSASIDGLRYPAAIGKEVPTSDNRFLDTKRFESSDKSGIVYSVPFFGEDGALKGAICGVLLSNVLAEMLPGKDIAVTNSRYGYAAFKKGGEAQSLEKLVRSDSTPPEAIFSEVSPLRVNDIGGGWKLWVSVPNSEFDARPEVRAADRNRVTAYLASITTIGFILILVVISGRRQSQMRTENAELQEALDQRTADLVNSRKLEAIGQLASGVAHEINTPAQFINDNLRFLESGTKKVALWHDKLVEALHDQPSLQELIKDRSVQRFIKEAPLSIADSLDGTARINEIVRAMRDYAHPGSAPLSEANINSIIENTIVIARNTMKKAGVVETDLRESLPSAYCNSGEIGQVLLNLFVNASHAIMDTRRDDGKIMIRTWHEEEWILISVEDNGSGIPDEIKARIFEQFFTTKDVGVGTGMGLSIVKHVVEKHGGSIMVDSTIGVGTTFTLRIPRFAPVELAA